MVRGSSNGLLELLHGFRHAGPRRFLATAERVRYLLVGAALDLPQHERGTLSAREQADSVPKVRDGHAVWLGRGKTQIRDRHEPALVSRAIDRLVRRDLVEPRPLLARARRWPSSERGEEGLLIEVVGVAAIPGEPQRVREGLAFVPLEQLADVHRDSLTPSAR